MADDKGIRVAIRVRPMNTREKGQATAKAWKCEDKSIQAIREKGVPAPTFAFGESCFEPQAGKPKIASAANRTTGSPTPLLFPRSCVRRGIDDRRCVREHWQRHCSGCHGRCQRHYFRLWADILGKNPHDDGQPDNPRNDPQVCTKYTTAQQPLPRLHFPILQAAITHACPRQFDPGRLTRYSRRSPAPRTGSFCFGSPLWRFTMRTSPTCCSRPTTA